TAIIRVDVAASLALGPFGSIGVVASGQIVIGNDDPGFSLYVELSANNLGIDPIFTLSGNLKLKINTRVTHSFTAANGAVIPAAGSSHLYFEIAITNLSLDLF